MGILVALIVLGIIVVIHELGHFLVAKAFRIKVDTFSIGFGPRIAGFRYGETDYRFSAFPLGGYVRMSGDPASDNLLRDSNEFTSKPRYQRFLVAIAGPAMNLVLAIGLLTGLFMVHGFPTPKSNAAADSVVVQEASTVRPGFVPALTESVKINSRFAALIFDSLGKLVRGEASLKELEGPVGIIRTTGQVANQSSTALVMMMAIISLNLAIMNLLPIPMLDGGAIVLLLVEALMGRDLSLIVKERILQAGLVLLLIVFVFVLYNDVVKLAVPSAL